MPTEKDQPLLIDELHQATYKNPKVFGRLRTPLIQARRFSLDTDMSSFLADLGWAYFKDMNLKHEPDADSQAWHSTGTVTIRPKFKPHRFVADEPVGAVRRTEVSDRKVPYARKLDGLFEAVRQRARGPHETTWIEYDHRARMNRQRDYNPALTAEEDQLSPKAGWLIESHPEIEFVYKATMCMDLDDGTCFASPWAWAWSSDNDTMIPWVPSKVIPEEEHPHYAVGLEGYKTPYVRIVDNEVDLPRNYDEYYIREFAGDLRYLWAFLSTVNDIPVLKVDKKPWRGFMTKGRIRKYMQHSVIHLKVPARVQVQQFAQQVVAMARKRRHDVRGHWRIDIHNPGEEVWVRPHARGDASLGFVLHDYEVEKGTGPDVRRRQRSL